MEKINFCSAIQPKSLKEFPEERCEFCADYYRAYDVDALLADVRRLVEAARKVIKISDRNHDAWDDAKQAIAAVERHYLEAQ